MPVKSRLETTWLDIVSYNANLLALLISVFCWSRDVDIGNFMYLFDDKINFVSQVFDFNF